MSSLYSHSVLNLIVILAFVFALMYVVKKLKLAKYTQNKHIKVINSVPVGGKEKILLLEVNNTYLLIGATPNSIETLYVFDQLQQAQTVDSKDAGKKTFAEQMKAEQYETCQDRLS